MEGTKLIGRVKAKEEKYVDIEIRVTPDGHITARSQQGGAISDISIDPPPSISLALNLIDERKADSKVLKEVGRSLYEWLFPKEIHTIFEKTDTYAMQQRAHLRLRLQIEAETISSLPLEFLYREIGGYYLAINPNTVLSRYLEVAIPGDRVRDRDGPLHMLAIIADPIDQVRLNPDTWESLIQEALAIPLKEGQMTLDVVKRATRKEIRNALDKYDYDIIQFVGHGTYEAGTGYLALVDEKNNDKTWKVDDDIFANLFLGHDENLCLMCLATCESAQSEDPQGFIGIAPKLVQRGIPAVVAMQYEVYINTAKVFLEDFYKSVAAGKPIDWATQSARNAISQEYGSDKRDVAREFATPVLYMRAKDGVLFNTPKDG